MADQSWNVAKCSPIAWQICKPGCWLAFGVLRVKQGSMKKPVAEAALIARRHSGA
jgi:hypothetical protein